MTDFFLCELLYDLRFIIRLTVSSLLGQVDYCWLVTDIGWVSLVESHRSVTHLLYILHHCKTSSLQLVPSTSVDCGSMNTLLNHHIQHLSNHWHDAQRHCKKPLTLNSKSMFPCQICPPLSVKVHVYHSRLYVVEPAVYGSLSWPAWSWFVRLIKWLRLKYDRCGSFTLAVVYVHLHVESWSLLFITPLMMVPSLQLRQLSKWANVWPWAGYVLMSSCHCVAI